MNQVQSIIGSHKRSLKKYQTRSENIDKAIKKLEDERRKMVYPHFMTKVIEPLGKMLCDAMKGRTYEVLGPFGICAEVSIHFHKTGVPEKERFEGNNCKSISFISYGDTIAIRDRRSKPEKKFAENTIGAINGMNHKTVEIPADADLNWFKKFIA